MKNLFFAFFVLSLPLASSAAGPFEGRWSYSQSCGWRHAASLHLTQKGPNVSGIWSDGHRAAGWGGELKGQIKNDKLFVQFCDDDESGDKEYICPNFEPESTDHFIIKSGKLVWYRGGEKYITLHKEVKNRPVPQDNNCSEE
ncbi:MAG: hypothetical protein Q4G70_00440 [Pseudomonadota bacterium]|nr:hypothetical protein [Pseudomonadota bacterium]